MMVTHGCLAAGAAGPAERRWGGSNLPAGIKITLESAKPGWFYGETVLLYYRVENTGSAAFNLSVGGDYRGSRATRFKVSATSDDGQAVEDPEPEQMNFGGLSPNAEVKPGDSSYENVHVLEYCRFQRPGTYTIRVFHDLGCGEKREHDPREVSLTFTLRAPTPAQAEAILVADETTPAYRGGLWGAPEEPRLDYYRIRNPVFLPALIQRAQKANLNALAGIDGIPTIEATRALVNLLDQSDAAFATKALSTLESRLPHPAGDLTGPWAAYRKQTLVSNAWDNSSVGPVRDFALNLLAKRDREDFLTATPLLRCIGTPRELPAVMAALEFAVPQTEINGGFHADLGYPQPVSACDRLVETATLIDRGTGTLPRDIDTPGHALLFIATRATGSRDGADNYESNCAILLNHPLAYVRAKALDSLLTNVPPSLAELVTARMSDPDYTVKNYAFQAARNMNDARHRELALAVLKSAGDQWLRGSASDIALKYGARFDCAMAWVTHLVRPADVNDYTAHDALLHLYSITMRPSGGSASGGGGFNPPLDEAGFVALRQRWVSFLMANKDLLNGGHAFKPGDADMPADLLPAGFEYH